MNAFTTHTKYLPLVWLRGIASLKADANSSYLGLLWWILEPLALTALFYVAFRAGIRGGGRADFVIFLICGLYPLKWTTSTLSNCANSLISNKGIMGQMYLPKWIFPTIVNVSNLMRFFIVIPLLMIFVLMVGKSPDLAWFSLIHIVIVQFVFNIGIGLFLASLVPLAPDLSHVIPLTTTALMFTSGIFFDINTRSQELQEILRINPFVGIVENYRSVLLDGIAVDSSSLLYAWTVSACLIFLGLAILKMFDRYYPRALT